MSDTGIEIGLGGLFAFADAILGVGVVLPGEVGVSSIATAVDASQRIMLLCAVTLGATAGDHLNYGLGRLLGTRLTTSWLITRIGTQHWDRAVSLIHRHGAWAIAGSRLIPVVRTLTPAAAGAAGLPYRRFALASLTGSALWAVTWVLAGAAVRNTITNPLWTVPVIAAGVVLLLVRRRPRHARERSAPHEARPAAASQGRRCVWFR